VPWLDERLSLITGSFRSKRRAIGDPYHRGESLIPAHEIPDGWISSIDAAMPPVSSPRRRFDFAMLGGNPGREVAVKCSGGGQRQRRRLSGPIA
jgi:hypothetical protein